jgi:hypothetical protein
LGITTTKSCTEQVCEAERITKSSRQASLQGGVGDQVPRRASLRGGQATKSPNEQVYETDGRPCPPSSKSRRRGTRSGPCRESLQREHTQRGTSLAVGTTACPLLTTNIPWCLTRQGSTSPRWPHHRASKVTGMAEATRQGAITERANLDTQKDDMKCTMEGECRAEPINPEAKQWGPQHVTTGTSATNPSQGWERRVAPYRELYFARLRKGPRRDKQMTFSLSLSLVENMPPL